MLIFSVPLNNLIGPSISVLLVGGAVTVAIVMGVYGAYLKRQEAGWAKNGLQK